MARNRDYRREYLRDHASPEAKKDRAARNAARDKMEKAGKVKKGDGKDVGHKTPLKRGGSNSMGNLYVAAKSKNRGWRKGKSGYNP